MVILTTITFTTYKAAVSSQVCRKYDGLAPHKNKANNPLFEGQKPDVWGGGELKLANDVEIRTFRFSDA